MHRIRRRINLLVLFGLGHGLAPERTPFDGGQSSFLARKQDTRHAFRTGPRPQGRPLGWDSRVSVAAFGQGPGDLRSYAASARLGLRR